MTPNHTAPTSWPWPASALASSGTDADADADAEGRLIHAAEASDLPTSFGVFKPIDHVMVGLPSQGKRPAKSS